MPDRVGIDRTRARGSVSTIEDAIAETRAAYAVAEARLRDELGSLTERLVLDPSLGAAAFRREQVEAVLAQVAELRAELDGEARRFAEQRLGQVYTSGANRAARILGRPPGEAFGMPHRRALEAMAGDLFDDLASATSYVELSAKRSIREATRLGSIVRGATGGSIDRSTRSLLEAFDRRGVDGFVAANGARWRLSSYASMVLRTKSASAYNTGTVLRSREYGTDVFTIRDGDRSGHAECVRYDGTTCTGAWAFAHPIEHPNCVRSFSPEPLHRGPVDHGSSTERETVDLDRFTADEAEAVRDLATAVTLDAAGREALYRRLPQGRAFDAPDGVPSMDRRTTGPARAFSENGRLYAIERTAIPRGATYTIDDVLGQAVTATRRAHPAGVVSPLREVVYVARPLPRYGDAAGLANPTTVLMQPSVYLHGATDLPTFLRAGTLTHEAGHSIAHAASRVALERLDDAATARLAAYREAADAAPDWLVASFGGREEWLAAANRGYGAVNAKTSRDVLEWAGLGSLATAEQRKQATAWLRLRNRKVKAADTRLDALDGFVGWPRAHLDRAIDSIIDARDLGRPIVLDLTATTAKPGARFVTAGQDDAVWLQRVLREDARTMGEVRTANGLDWPELRSTVWDTAPGAITRTPTLDGWHRWGSGSPRPGVTDYAASASYGVEDWAETWRLFVQDRQRGGLGTTHRAIRDADGWQVGTTPVRVRFEDAYPNRAAYLREWADALGYDLDSLTR